MKHLVAKLFVLVLFFWGCKSQPVAQQPVQETNPRPEWLKHRPIDASYYIGISGSSKLQDKFGYAANAQSKALENIASEIKVKVESNSVLYQLERNSEFKDSYESIVRSKTSQNLEGYELVDSWENDEEYWVYYRLSKLKFQETEKQKHQVALDKALGFYKRGIDAEKGKQLTLAVKMHLSSLKALENYLGDVNTVDYEGRSISLTQSNFDKLQNLFLSVKIVGQSEYKNIRGVTRNQELKVSTEYNGKVQGGIPLSIKFKTGDGEFGAETSSNSSGNTKFILKKVVSPNLSQEVLVTIDNTSHEGDFLSKALLQNLELPQMIISLDVNNPSVFIESNEKAFGSKKSCQFLAQEIKKQGVNHGLAIASAKKNADLIVKIEADTRKGAENSGVFVAYLNADVFVFDQKGKQLYQGKLVDVKGVQLDYNGASDDAYKKAIKPLDKKILREIQKVLFD